jgi:hypothetical protein
MERAEATVPVRSARRGCVRFYSTQPGGASAGISKGAYQARIWAMSYERDGYPDVAAKIMAQYEERVAALRPLLEATPDTGGTWRAYLNEG